MESNNIRQRHENNTFHETYDATNLARYKTKLSIQPARKYV